MQLNLVCSFILGLNGHVLLIELFSSTVIRFQTLGCKPIASLDHFQPEMLGSADLVEEVPAGDSKIVKVICLLFALSP